MQLLNPAFLDAMRALLGDRFEAFCAGLDAPPYRGLRANPLKCTADKLQTLLGALIPTPFCEDGFYLDAAQTGIGKTPLHHAGAFYVQEPSATSVVGLLDIQKGERVLDLCAAPGGKSTQIAAALSGTGVLVANEYVASRAKSLLSNLERCGVPNAIVLNGRPDKVCAAFSGYFDKVLVDAPCSGEGMFRKEPRAAREWSEQAVHDCAKRQAQILKSARQALRSGGTLVYSTCTFSAEENERQIDRFLKENPDFCLCDARRSFGGSLDKAALPDLAADGTKMLRIFPFDGGEGQFAAKLKYCGSADETASVAPRVTRVPLFEAFWKAQFTSPVPQTTLAGDAVYLPPPESPPLDDVRPIRAGVCAGRVVGNRFEPAHHLYTTARRADTIQAVDLALSDPRLAAFLHGAEIPCDRALRGYAGVFVEGIALGFGKASNGVLKNHYPKGLRNL